MARTFVEAGRRRQFTPTLQHKAGDLVYKDGFYGVAQDDAVFNSFAPSAAARDFMHILEGVWDLPANLGFATTINAGVKVAADATYSATTLKIWPFASLGTAANAFGRVWATAAAGASLVRVLLFSGENPY